MTTETTTNEAPTTGETTYEAMKLGDEFDGALIGATIRGQFAYSLVVLTEMASERFGLDLDAARAYVGHNVVLATREAGDAAPVFVDDELVRGAPVIRGTQRKGSQIVIPGQSDVPKDILVPGQNTGAVKGFIAPNDLKG